MSSLNEEHGEAAEQDQVHLIQNADEESKGPEQQPLQAMNQVQPTVVLQNFEMGVPENIEHHYDEIGTHEELSQTTQARRDHLESRVSSTV